MDSNDRLFALVFSLLIIGCMCQCSSSTESRQDSPGNITYYINPTDGDDGNSGIKKGKAWRSFSHINRMKFSSGDRVVITTPGSFDQTLILKGEGTADNPIEVSFAPGNYNFFTDNISTRKYNISNTNAQPDSSKAVGILLEKAKHVNISGPGATIICRGKMVEVAIDSCEYISVADLSFDYHRPTVSEFTVIDAGDNYAKLQIHRDSKYKIEQGNLIWYGEGWTATTRMLGQELNLKTNDVRRLWDPVEGMQFEELEPGIVMARGAHKVKKDYVYQMRETFRDYAAVFTRRSKNISWRRVNFYFLHGMGLVSQFSENLTYDAVSVAPEKTSGRTTAAWADILHMSGCKGKIVVKNCIFKGAHDDAINIHGTYLRVVEKIFDKQIKVRFMHKQTYGFMAVNPGDEIEFVDSESYASHGMNKVKDAKLLNPKEILVTLENITPQELELEDVIENVTWTPEVEIRGCHISWIPTRGFLLASRKKIVVEENDFFATHMSAILLGIDANNWYESGFVRDMTIRNNKFIHCAEPVIHIDPRNNKSNDNVHQNIRIVNNEFILRDELVLEAKSARNIRIEGNTIVSKKKLNNAMVVNASDCSEINIGKNDFRKSSGF